MFKLFKAKHPNINVFYYKFLKDNFNLRFWRSQVDTYCTCEKLKPKFERCFKKVVAAKLVVHDRKSKKFYNKLKAEEEVKNKNQSNVIALCFDYM